MKRIHELSEQGQLIASILTMISTHSASDLPVRVIDRSLLKKR
jgi:hypothetical protein